MCVPTAEHHQAPGSRTALLWPPESTVLMMTWSAATLATEPQCLLTCQAQELTGEEAFGVCRLSFTQATTRILPRSKAVVGQIKSTSEPTFHLQPTGNAHKQGNIKTCYHQYSPTLSQPSAQGPPQPEVVPLCLVNLTAFQTLSSLFLQIPEDHKG